MRKDVSPESSIRHLSHHLPYNHFYVLVIDRDTLQPVDLLHFINEITLELLWTEDIKYAMGIDRPVHKRLTSLDPVSLMNTHMLAFRYVILFRRLSALHHDNTLALLGASELDDTVDLGYNRLLLGLPCLKQFSDPRQTSGNIFCLGRLSRYLCEDVSRMNNLVFCQQGYAHPRAAGTAQGFRCPVFSG